MIKVFKKEIGGLHEAAYLLAFFTILSQILGLVRDRLLTYFLGVGADLDIYYAAFKIPDIIFFFSASVVSVSVLVPFIAEKMEEGNENAKKFTNSVFALFSVFIIVVSIVAFFVMPYILPVLFPRFSPESMSTLVNLSRILLLQPILLGVSNFFGSIVQSFRQFIVYASGPVLYNAGIIIGIIFLYPYFGLYGLVYGVLIGALLYILVQIPTIVEKGFFPKFSLDIDWPKIKKVVVIALPRTFTLGVGSLSILFLVSLASRIMEGSVSIFSLSMNLQSVPLAVVGVSYSMAAFPLLSSLFSKNKIEAFINEIKVSLQHIIFWSLPIIALFVVLRAQIVRVILGSSTKFTWTDTKLTAAVFAMFTISVLAQAVVMLFTRVYYSAKITYVPLIVNSICAGLSVILGFAFLRIFRSYPWFSEFMSDLWRVDSVTGNEVLMLALGFTVSAILNALILWYLLEKKFGGFTRGVIKTFIQSMVSALFIGVISYSMLNVFDSIFALDTVVGVFLQGFCSGIIGIAVGIIFLVVVGN
ncbi:MAG: lipid II flippase MurJ, partial [bacterium]|nr:lipid II flippase MurJ [bacterium]